ncbi:iron-sulfur cluster assembly scaffold protein [Croceicoccus bisphenolivorans]|uniref:iron-sulfur cluster assembly scaffold protein n=1 Tax=Croceicoccus bisphenolivorans TaxID=1783232 RepID=UPI0008336271|nr:iron-sulfur cluster assembly scaffold protein [Croceicoccus bisphenolivorans]
MSGHRLYTPEVLAAAVSLADFPLLPTFTLRGEARSKSCGSRIELGLILNDDGCVESVGLASRACAIGQASAAVFAKGAMGKRVGDLIAARDAMSSWLAGTGPVPEWPGVDLIVPAIDYPGRHGAMILPWAAACDALCKGVASTD